MNNRLFWQPLLSSKHAITKVSDSIPPTVAASQIDDVGHLEYNPE
jgi:hypothetical protein